ncbi:TasA family protein [Halobacillus naozhouensis]|uniref:TasA family protein n=1 Tax=Halobacillus naozhouensis TaxID=554880 RepID=A0ABY8IYU6_9BACI|nr:TasA family protein [Halobacillus naozhouensis]WFT74547.1 TasA family protein [Halobacillus naozhouensis]
MEKSWKIFCALCLSFICLIIFSDRVQAAEEEKEVNIGTSPESVLFEVSNLKPGDTMTRQVEISNLGVRDFTYTTVSKLAGGSEKLFRALRIQVTDQTGMQLYAGSLKGLSELDKRSLKVSEEDRLTLTVEMPFELGNDYQGLAGRFEIKFTAEGEDSIARSQNPEPSDQPPVGYSGVGLPDTATSLYNILLLGLAMVLMGTGLYVVNYVRNHRAD